MSGRIYVLNDGNQLTPLQETPYDSEKLLQTMLADYPDLLAGEQIQSEDPRRWLLITREMGVPGEIEGVARWSIDHLFLDQEGVPTLVEVKQSTNGDIRRKVVGQMLDYAANAVAYWPVELIREKFHLQCERKGDDPAEILENFLNGDHSIDDFWQLVKTNLQAGRIRMLFLADSIPSELRRVVEFLNQQMDPAEVLAIEVRQFVGEKIKTFVPHVYGQTEYSRQKKTPDREFEKKWDKPRFLAELEKSSGVTVRETAEELLGWFEANASWIWYGSGTKDGGIVPMFQQGPHKYQLCRLGTGGIFAFWFDCLRRRPAFKDESARRKLLEKINSIPGVRFGDDMLVRRAHIPFELLTSPETIMKLKEIFSWMIDRAKSES